MDLPSELRAGVESLLSGVPLAALKGASARLSERYRGEVRDGRLHLDDALAVKAYLAARMPATYGAIVSALREAAEALPDFAPSRHLDVGAGPGTAWWAARSVWDRVVPAELIEASAAARQIGAELIPERARASVTWTHGDALSLLRGRPRADLVTVSYMMDELDPASMARLADDLWSASTGLLVVVEPGTPAGWQRIVALRQRLVAAGAQVVAPCAHERPCPLAAPDWCHFARRIARSRLHRMVKEGDAPFEDEKFTYVALSRQPVPVHRARVLAPPRSGKGVVSLKLCLPDGSVATQSVSRRAGDAFRVARRLDWGDSMPVGSADTV